MDLCRKKMNTVPFQEEYFYYTVEDAKDEKKLRSSWEINKKCKSPTCYLWWTLGGQVQQSTVIRSIMILKIIPANCVHGCRF